jgi:predicted aminopeptidase
MRPTIPYQLLAVTLAAGVLAGCAGVRYYADSAAGELDLLMRSRPLAEVVADPHTSASLRHKLKRVIRIRDFASRELGLPDNDSYRSYADLERPYVVWNVFAAPLLSIKPEQWCFPIVGCVAYRGYFEHARAERFAAGLRRKGLDVYVAGVPAFSTLGWFDDPVLNTVIDLPEEYLAGLIFHELAHQLYFIKGDTPFNESFATAVELEGSRRWFAAEGDAARARAYRKQKARDDQVVALIMDYRERLARIYAAAKPDAWKLAAKRRTFTDLKRSYGKLKQSWGGYAGYDRWFAQDLNNATLASVGAYHQYVPAFQALLKDCGGKLECFYAEVKRIGSLPAARRHAVLDALQSRVTSN